MQISISKAKVKSLIRGKVDQTWQERRQGEGKGDICSSSKVTRAGSGHRREETALTKLRLGHCALTKDLKSESPTINTNYIKKSKLKSLLKDKKSNIM